MIKKKDLVDGAYYLGKCRNATVARWHQANNKFYHNRTKFGQRFLEEINHFEDFQGFDVFEPYVVVNEGNITEKINTPV